MQLNPSQFSNSPSSKPTSSTFSPKLHSPPKVPPRQKPAVSPSRLNKNFEIIRKTCRFCPKPSDYSMISSKINKSQKIMKKSQKYNPARFIHAKKLEKNPQPKLALPNIAADLNLIRTINHETDFCKFKETLKYMKENPDMKVCRFRYGEVKHVHFLI